MSPSTSILCFGDGSFALDAWVQHLTLSQSQGSILSQFLDETTLVLHHEVKRAHELFGEPSLQFCSLHELFRTDPTEQLHPALHAASVVMVQLGTFISHFEKHPEVAFPNDASPCIGFCLGEISAAVIAYSRSLLHTLYLSQTAICTAFRMGLLAAQTRDSIEPRCRIDESWSVALDQSLGIDGDTLDEFHRAELIGRTKFLWIGYCGRKTISVFGTPKTIERFLSWLKQKPRFRPETFVQQIAIHAPYHAPHLYSNEAIRRALQGISTFDEQVRPLISTTAVLEDNLRDHELVTIVATSILARPMRWSRGVESLQAILKNENHGISLVHTFGPSAIGQQLANALKDDVDLTVVKAMDPIDTQAERSKNRPIAIVGIGVRLPGATNVDELWSALLAGTDFSRSIPKDRFDPETHLKGKAYGCFIENLGHFDSKFYNISPREAAQTDPGHRLAMITALEAMENAGMVVGRTPSTQSNRIGTFYGQTVDEYKEQNMPLNVDTYYIPGSLRAFAPGRLNYFFKFCGPAYAIDTACSSGAVAINLACRSIWSGECDTALAGGINTLCGCDNFNGLIAGQFLSPTGNCKTFDHDADGYCRAEGVCSLVLKRLDAAQADNDNILGIISATVTNFSAEAASITRPHGPTQEKLYKSALQEAGLRPPDVDYVELHGTGTQAGDQVETKSVLNIFAPLSKPLTRPLYLSAVKPNLGHSEAASGPTSLIKAVQVLRKGEFPPHVGIKGIPNKLLPDFESHNVRVSDQALAYPPKASGKRRAVVSNFSAAGGCTAFVVEEPPLQMSSTIERDCRSKKPICLSAKSKVSLLDNIQHLSDYLVDNPDASLADISYTTCARRTHYSLRKTIAATSIQDLQDQMARFDVGAVKVKQNSKIVFAFTGQGSWYKTVAKQLFESCAVFRKSIQMSIDTCLRLGLPSFLPLIKEDSLSDCNIPPAQSHLCIVAVEMALFHFWTSLGIKDPVAVIGHSLGEYSALYAAGVLTASDTLHLVGERALMLEQYCEPRAYGMLAVQGAKDDLQDYLIDGIEIACINGPEDTVLSGPTNLISHLKERLSVQSIKSTQLKLDYGFHSAQVEPILDRFESTARKVAFKAPSIPVASTLLGKVITEDGIFDHKYIQRQCRQTADFVSALGALEEAQLVDDHTFWLELGPQPLCSRMITKTLKANCVVLHSLRKGDDDWSSICASATALQDAGFHINWQQYHSDFESSLTLITLPTYAFDMKNHWIPYNNFLLNRSSPTSTSAGTRQSSLEHNKPLTTSLHKMTLCSQPSKEVVEMTFETMLGEHDIHSAIMGHAVRGVGLCPAVSIPTLINSKPASTNSIFKSIYGDIALTIGNMVRERYEVTGPTDAMDISAMAINKPITMTGSAADTNSILKVSASANLCKGTINIALSLLGDKIPRATCVLVFGSGESWSSQWARTRHHTERSIDLLEAGVLVGESHRLQRGMVYKLFANVVEYEDKYQAMQNVTMNSKDLEACARLQLYRGKQGGHFYCSPFWVDAIVHLAGFVMNTNENIDTHEGVFISGGWDNFKLSQPVDPTKTYRVYVKMVHVTPKLVAGDVVLVHANQTVGLVENLRFQRVPSQLLMSILMPGHVDNKQPEMVKQVATPKSSKTYSRHTGLELGPHGESLPHGSEAQAALQIVADEIGVPLSDLTEDVSLTSLGVDSLLSLSITSKLEQNLRFTLNQEMLMNCETIGQLRTAIEHSWRDGGSDDSDESYSTASTRSGSIIATPDAKDAALVSLPNAMLIARQIVAQQIGIDEQELLLDQDLSELGVDSLLSWSISSALKAELGIAIAPEDLCGKVTMQSLETRLLHPSPTATPEVRQQTNPPLSSSSGRSDSSDRAPLQLHRGSGPRKIFLFPDGGGSAAAYSALPVIEPAWSTWALSMGEVAEADESVESLAAQWVRQIQSLQPQGPYRLAGWSAGGFFALEAARQLLQQGQKVDRLVLVDSPCPTRYKPMPLEILELALENGVIGGGTAAGNAAMLAKIRRRFHRTITALASYRPEPLSSRHMPVTTLVWAEEGLETALPSHVASRARDGSAIADFLISRQSQRTTDGWEDLVGGQLQIHCTPGHHFSLVQRPCSHDLARALSHALRDEQGSK